MKNSKVDYPFDGTLALQPQFARATHGGTIIDFPSNSSRGATSESYTHALKASLGSHRAQDLPSFQKTARTLSWGSLTGCPYNCVKPWQGVLAGCIFSLTALISILIGC